MDFAGFATQRDPVSRAEARNRTTRYLEHDRHRPRKSAGQPVLVEHALERLTAHEARQRRVGPVGNLLTIHQHRVVDDHRRKRSRIGDVRCVPDTIDQAAPVRIDEHGDGRLRQ